MASNYRLHPAAQLEYAEAAGYYVREASIPVAERFVTEVETAISKLVANPSRWRVIEPPKIRRSFVSRFPFLVFYQWHPEQASVTIYAVMHSSREPGYWRERLVE